MSPSVRDRNLNWVLSAAAFVSAGILVLVVLFLARESWPAISGLGIARFFLDAGWHPTEGAFDVKPMLAASLLMSLLAVVLAVPLGVGAAVFQRFYAPVWMRQVFRWCVILLAGIPSVVFGLWGLTVIVPLILAVGPPGASLLAGSIVLVLMIVPTIALTTEAALEAVPQSYWTGAAALGLSREATLFNVTFPVIHSSVFAGVMLGLARALGETMAVLMVSGNVVQLPASVLDPVRTLTANIALEMAYATGDHRSSLFVSGLALTALVLALAWAARRSGGQVVHA